MTTTTDARQFWDTPMWAEYQRLCGVAANGLIRGVPVRERPHCQSYAVSGAESYRCRDVGWETWVLDLSPPVETLWAGLRKSYRQAILGVDKRANLVVSVVSLQDAALLMACCRLVHLQEVGRETRPADTWTLMADWIRDGHGHLIVAQDRSTLAVLGFAYVYVWGTWAYYGHAAQSRATRPRPVSHAIQWVAIQHLKSIGVQQYELGWQARPTDTDKDRAISFFKRGFGGAAWWQPMWERVEAVR